jgi:hypothetical protein
MTLVTRSNITSPVNRRTVEFSNARSLTQSGGVLDQPLQETIHSKTSSSSQRVPDLQVHVNRLARVAVRRSLLGWICLHE